MLDNYIITNEEIYRDRAFQWKVAEDKSTGNQVLLQMLSIHIPIGQIVILSDYFSLFESIKKEGLLTPYHIINSPDAPLLVVYPYEPFETFEKAVKKQPDKRIDWLYEASEQLFFLHNRNLIHGCVSPKHFIVIGAKLSIFNFGYYPLFSFGKKVVQKVFDNKYCAPEVLSEKIKPSNTIDIYGFAKTIGFFYPDIKTKNWYKKSTNSSSKKRFERMRDSFDAFQEIITNTSSKLAPKYRLSGYASPPKGGKINGTGNYIRSKKVNISAIPNDGYTFDHWKGDYTGTSEVASITMDSDKHITAVFKYENVSLTFAQKITVDILGIILGALSAFYIFHFILNS